MTNQTKTKIYLKNRLLPALDLNGVANFKPDSLYMEVCWSVEVCSLEALILANPDREFKFIAVSTGYGGIGETVIQFEVSDCVSERS